MKMEEKSAKTSGKSTMIVESHMTYNQELKLNDEVEINLVYFDHDKKRLHYRLEMYEKSKNILSATTEVLALYINLDLRKVDEFEKEKVLIIDNFIEENKSKFKFDSIVTINIDIAGTWIQKVNTAFEMKNLILRTILVQMYQILGKYR